MPYQQMRIDEPGEAAALLERHGSAVWRKFLAGLAAVPRGQVVVGSAWHSLLAVALALALPFGLRGPRRLRLEPAAAGHATFALGMVVLGIVAVSLSFPVERFGYPLRPLVLTASVALASSWLELSRASRPSRGAAMLVVGLLAASVPGARTLLGAESPLGAADERSHASLERLAELTGESALIASDVSYAVALHARRRTLRLPAEPADLFTLSERVLPVPFVYLSANIPMSGQRTKLPRGLFVKYPHYGAFARGEAFLARYELAEVLPDGSRLYVARSP
jgi:hypothetical protein